MTLMTLEEYIFNLYARYRRTGWRFNRMKNDVVWGIDFVCAGQRILIGVKSGLVYGQLINANDPQKSPTVVIRVDGNMEYGAYETLYRRLDKKAGVTRGK